MKTSLLSLAALALFFTTTTSFAAGPPADRRPSKEINYGYPLGHKVTAKERARWEAEQRKLAEQQRRLDEQRRQEEQRRLEEQRKQASRRDDRDFNYGYPQNHKVTPQERARWEAAQRNRR